MQNNFGEITPASLSGFVYTDSNNGGQIDFGEAAISGVVVTLTGTDINGNSISRTTTTDLDGLYLFDRLMPGTYQITETQLRVISTASIRSAARGEHLERSVLKHCVDRRCSWHQ